MSARRGYGAVLAALLWLSGFDVVPLAHMVLHETLEDHRHGHRHEQDHAHGHGHDRAAEDGERTPSPVEHGEGSVAHRDLAANVPLPAIPQVLGALLSREALVPPAHDERPADLRPRTSRARAPPHPAA
jgi:hypothetical protein